MLGFQPKLIVIEMNVFSAGHQDANGYGLPERRYEVRTEENTVDIQICEKSSITAAGA